MVSSRECHLTAMFLMGNLVIKGNAVKYWMIFFGGISLVSGWLRYLTGKSVPTAFSLLFLVVLLGLYG